VPEQADTERAMSLSTTGRKRIRCHVQPEALAPLCRAILPRMGYALEWADDEPGPAALGPPALLLVDERRLGEIEDDGGEPSAPIVLLTGRHGATGADSRIAGAIRRPAGLHDLYRLIQGVLEEYPRTTPRVATHLPARIARHGHEWRGALLSLSENGALLRSSAPLPLGSRFDLSFEIPRQGALQTEAEAAYQLLPDMGLVFHNTQPVFREAVADFIAETLLA
jgi:hypothetical protein